MKFAEYMTLKKRAEDVGIKDLSALKQLRTIIQVHEKAKDSFAKFNNEMNEWEQSYQDIIEDSIWRKEHEVEK
mgnify:FL=1|jgi:hypothetical protein